MCVCTDMCTTCVRACLGVCALYCPMNCVSIIVYIEWNTIGILNLLLRVQLWLTSFREIQYEINDGVSLSRLPISFPECRCPQTHPQFVMDAADPSGVFCKQLTTVDKVRRLSNGTVDNMRDNDYNTVWTSSESMPTIYFTFDQVFMVSILRLYIVLNCVCGLTTAFILFFSCNDI